MWHSCQLDLGTYPTYGGFMILVLYTHYLYYCFYCCYYCHIYSVSLLLLLSRNIIVNPTATLCNDENLDSLLCITI